MSDPVTDVSRDLAEILRLYNDLEAQAVRSTDRDMPGGTALVELGPVANLEAWSNQYDALETAYYAAKDAGRPATWPDLSHENDADQPVLQTLLYWTETLRVEHGEDWDHKVTIASEAHYLRRRLDWVWAHEPRFEDMAKDVHDSVTSLENLLRAGERSQRGVPCMYDECGGARLTRELKMESGKWVETDWRCPKCERRWDNDRYWLNVRAAVDQVQREVISGDEWCSVGYAASETGRSVKTIRTWVNRGQVSTACMVAGRRKPFVRLDEVREKETA